MIRTIGMAWAAMVAILLCSGIDNGATAQDTPPRAEVVPAPPAVAPPATAPISPYRPKQTYDPLQAGRDAYRIGEEERRWAIGRQLGALDYARYYGAWTAPRAYAYPLPSVYGYPWRRAVRRAYHGMYVGGVGPVIAPWPRVSVGVYGYPYDPRVRQPYYPRVRQPIGHEKISGPNGYIYRPIYAESAEPVPAGVPTPAAEPVPAPPAEPGPREF